VGLSVVASDDGLPASPGQLTYTWSVVLGSSGAVTFAAGNGTGSAATLNATVAVAGTYVFRVTVSDGEFSSTATTPELLVTSVTTPGVIAVTSPGTWTQAEGDSGVSTVAITVTRTGGSSGPVSVSYATQDGTAQAGGDFTAASGTISWADGDSTVKTITVPIIGDTVYEPSEQFSVQLGSPTGGASLGLITSATVTILNDDAAPSAGILSFDPNAYAPVEGDSGSTAVTITVTRSGGSAGAVSVVVTTADGTAQAGSDYLTASATLSWAAGASGARTLTVPILGDVVNEADETVRLVLSGPVGGAALGASTASLVIITDDAVQEAGILALPSPAPGVAEGGSGTTALLIPVVRQGGSAGAVSVTYALTGGTAQVGTDVQALGGTLSWAAGETGTRYITMTVLGDLAVEPDETAVITLSDPTGGARVPDTSVVVTITNDDAGSPAVPGDLNGSGTVTFEDLSLFLSSYGKSVGDVGFLSGANLATAGSSASIVDFEDLAAFLALYTP
jgi:hypothetical protein